MVSICVLLIVSGFRTYDYFLKEIACTLFLEILEWSRKEAVAF